MADLEQDAFDWEDEVNKKNEIIEKLFEWYLPNRDMESTIKNVEARIRREKKKEREEATRKAMLELDETNEEEDEEEEKEKQTMVRTLTKEWRNGRVVQGTAEFNSPSSLATFGQQNNAHICTYLFDHNSYISK